MKKVVLQCCMVLMTYFTSAQTTYTWSGGSASDFQVAANWTPKRSAVKANDVLRFSSNATITNVPTQTIGQLLLSNNANVSLQAASGASTILSVGSGGINGDDIDVPAGCTLVIAQNSSGISSEKFTLATANSATVTANIAGTLSIEKNTPSSFMNEFSVFYGVTTISGTVNYAGTFTNGNVAKLIFLAGSTLNYLREIDANFPLASYTDVNLNVTGYISGFIANFPSSIANLTWNCPTQTGNITIVSTTLVDKGTSIAISGNVNLVSTGTGGIYFDNIANMTVGGNFTTSILYFDFSRTTAISAITINGDLTIAGTGTFVNLLNRNSGGTVTLTVNNYIQNEGTFTLAASSATNGTANLVVKGNFTKTAGKFNTNNTSGIKGNLVFNGLLVQNFNAVPTITTNPNLEVNNPQGLNLQTPFYINNLTLSKGVVTTSNANKLYLASAGIIVGGGIGSYIDGPVYKATASTTPFSLPLGKNGQLRNVIIEPQTNAASAYTVEFLQKKYTNTTSLSAPITSVNAAEYFTILGTSTSAAVKVTLDYSFASGVVSNTADLVVAGYVGGKWTIQGTTPIVSGTPTNGSVASNSYIAVANTTLPLTIGSISASTALPLPLTSFTGISTGKVNVIKWTISNESAPSNYILERQLTSQAFLPIAKIPSKGKEGVNEYQFIDNEVSKGVNAYYRLKQLDMDGNTSYSPVIKIGMGGNSELNGLLIYPNPCHNQLVANYTSTVETKVRVLLYDVTGKLVLQSSSTVLKGTNSLVADISKLTRGLYTVKLLDEFGNSQTKAVKVN